MNKDSLISTLSRFLIETRRLRDESLDAEDRRIFDRYLAGAEVVLGKIEQDQGIGDNIDQMERLFGNTWVKDGAAYERAYATWDEFKALLRESIHGMTVNERLYSLGLMDEFDRAVEQKSEDRLKVVLGKCFLSHDNIRVIIDQKLKR